MMPERIYGMSGMGPEKFQGPVDFLNIASIFRLNLKRTKATISGGAITFNSSYMIVDTEAAAATDNLDTINGGQTGDILILRTEDNARDVVVRHAQGNIYCGSNRTLGARVDRLALIYDADVAQWSLLAFADNSP